MSLVVEMSGCFIVTACASQLKSNIMLLLREPVQSLDWVPGKKKLDWVIELSSLISLITGVFDRDSSRQHMESQMGVYEGAKLRNAACLGKYDKQKDIPL